MFTGIGGFEFGIENANNKSLIPFKVSGGSSLRSKGAMSNPSVQLRKSFQGQCVGYSEIVKFANAIYKYHYKDHINYGDATKIKAKSLPDFDLLFGGFPCQAFSLAGLRKGFKDSRGTLFFDICRIIKAKKPKNFILENVKGLLSHDSGKTFKTIIYKLTRTITRIP